VGCDGWLVATDGRRSLLTIRAMILQQETFSDDTHGTSELSQLQVLVIIWKGFVVTLVVVDQVTAFRALRLRRHRIVA
jgi:hypothetical protein